MHLEAFLHQMLPEIESELKTVVDETRQPLPPIHELPQYSRDGLTGMLSYHLGWDSRNASTEAKGKRIRPVLLLLACSAWGGDWRAALPAAAAVELVHNFSLIHDDIQDKSPFRHGRATVWRKWGEAQAINAGDLMFTIANRSIIRLAETRNAETALRAVDLLHTACVQLTYGQFLDLYYESVNEIPMTAYWPMVEGKTAALLACCAQLGGLIGGADKACQTQFAEFGRCLGLAFQVQDDWLGIWGDIALTGKPRESDLVSRKKSLPILYALEQKKAFFERWIKGAILPGDVVGLASILESEGAQQYTLQTAQAYTQQALAALERAAPPSEARLALIELAQGLLQRKS